MATPFATEALVNVPIGSLFRHALPPAEGRPWPRILARSTAVAAVAIAAAFGPTAPPATELQPPSIAMGCDAIHFKLRDQAAAAKLSRELRRLGADLPGPMFHRTAAAMRAEREQLLASGSSDVPDLTLWWRLPLRRDRTPVTVATAHAIVRHLAADRAVETVFLAPIVEPARLSATSGGSFCPIRTPPYDRMQGYLAPAPDGIGVESAWASPGGKGQGLWFADVEGGWNTRHEDIPGDRMRHVAGEPIPDRGWQAHGTAVIGEVASRDNGLGMTGIAPDVERIFTGSIAGPGVAAAIDTVAAHLRPGDVLLIELHGPGPRSRPGGGQKGFVPVEWWQDVFDVIRVATARGVVIVEAAGNGGENLDDPIYRRAFDRGVRDSGAIMVGAGAPADHAYVDRSRLWFSNYGARVDLQGWGLEVATLDYGDLQRCDETTRIYTGKFGGTSGASPIVVGAALCLQGIHRARTGRVMTGDEIRKIMQRTGTPQTDGPHGPATQHIGPRPDLARAIEALPRPLAAPVWLGWRPGKPR